VLVHPAPDTYLERIMMKTKTQFLQAILDGKYPVMAQCVRDEVKAILKAGK